MSIEKHRLASMLRVPMRDLRMLEPNFSNSYSAAILCRERCIVLHLEQVRLLITAEEVRYFAILIQAIRLTSCFVHYRCTCKTAGTRR